MKITKIENGYFVEMEDGSNLSVPEATGNWHWQMVQEAIASGAVVHDQEAPDAPVPALTFMQLMIGLVAEEWITQAEGEGWLAGTLPQSVLDLIATLPPAEQFAAKARATRPTVIDRDEPLVGLLAASQGKTPADLDAFFRGYSEI